MVSAKAVALITFLLSFLIYKILQTIIDHTKDPPPELGIARTFFVWAGLALLVIIGAMNKAESTSPYYLRDTTWARVGFLGLI